MAYEAQAALTKEQAAYLRRLNAFMVELGTTPQGASIRDFLGFLLFDLRMANDVASGEKLLRNQGAIAVCLQLMECMQPERPAPSEQRQADPRSPEERAAAPDAGY